MPLRNKSDSALNSLECWDYSVELECLNGPDGKFKFPSVARGVKKTQENTKLA